MDLDAIAVFVKVVEAGSFSGAARLLKMPKTTVSAKVAALEKRLGVSLIQRTTRKLHVTDAGSKYFHHCAIAMQEVEQAESALRSVQGKPTGLLKITAPVDLAHTVLPPIVGNYLARYPDTTVELVVSNQVTDLIGEGIDLALRAGVMKDSSLIARRFFELGANVWAAPTYLDKTAHRNHPRDAAKHLFVGRTGTKTIHFTNGRSDLHVPVTARVQADDLETIKALVIAGAGIGWLPDFLAADAVADGRLVQVFPKWRATPAGAVYFVFPGQKYASPKVQAFIETAFDLLSKPAMF